MEENLPRLQGETRLDEKEYQRQSDSGSPCRDRLLLKTASLLVRSGPQSEPLKEFAAHILTITGCDFLKFSLHDPRQNCMITHYWKSNQESGQFDAFAIDECVSGWVWTHQKPVVISEVENDKRFPQCIQELRKHSVRSYIMLPLTSSERRFGAMGIGKSIPEIVHSEDLEFFQRVAFIVSLALENREKSACKDAELTRLRGLVTIAQELAASLDMQTLVTRALNTLRQITGHEHAVLMEMQPDGKMLRSYAMDSAYPEKFAAKDVSLLPLDRSLSKRTMETRTANFWSQEDWAQFDTPIADAVRACGIQSVIQAPLLAGEEVFGTLNLASRRKNAFSQADLDYLQQVANLIAPSMRNTRAYQEVAKLKDRLAGEKR